MLSFRRLIVPYFLPYFAYVGIASVSGDLVGLEASYGLRIAVVGPLLLWARRWHCPLTGPGSVRASVVWGTGAGLAGTALWVVLAAPFVQAGAARDWSPLAAGLRLAAAGALVPYFEELALRGFVFRLALMWGQERARGEGGALQTVLDGRSPDEVVPGQWSWTAVIASTVAFVAGHGMNEWPAATAYGLLMCGLWVFRKDLVSCIAAHAATNVGLALYVMGTGNWQYW